MSGRADWRLDLTLLREKLSVCRLASAASVPPWAWNGEFASVTRTAEELSVVCRDGDAPEGARCERGWRVFKVEGPFDFALTGILAAAANPLKDAGVGIFAMSTFDTDYVMVKEADVDRAIRALEAAGHRVKGAG